MLSVFFACTVIFLGLAGMVCGIERTLHSRLERESFQYANRYFADQYFDHQRSSRRYIKLEGHRLIYRNKKQKHILSVYQIKSVQYRWFRIHIRLQSGTSVTLPIGFRHQPVLYAILKYHRPVSRHKEERYIISTRKGVRTSLSPK